MNNNENNKNYHQPRSITSAVASRNFNRSRGVNVTFTIIRKSIQVCTFCENNRLLLLLLLAAPLQKQIYIIFLDLKTKLLTYEMIFAILIVNNINIRLAWKPSTK